ncbi:PI-PLC X domain-containing protein [Tanacetum coccineum]
MKRQLAPAIDTLKEIEAFLSANPSEIVTIILEDYVQAPNGLTNVFTDAGLKKYMPKGGQDWPLVKDMVSNNQRLLVFGSVKSKEQSEGIAYQWNYMVENQYGDGGMKAGECPNRGESSPLNDTSKSLVLVNYFRTIPLKVLACGQNSGGLLNMTNVKHIKLQFAIVFYMEVRPFVNIQRSEGGGTFQAVDLLNGEHLCGCNDVHSCVSNPEFPLQLLENQSPMSIQCDLGLDIEEDTCGRIPQDLGSMLSIKMGHSYFPTI